MLETTHSVITSDAQLAVVQVISEGPYSPQKIEDVCIDLLVKTSLYPAKQRCMTRVVEDVVRGAISGAGAYRYSVTYAAIRASVRVGPQIGLNPVSAAVVAIESAASGWSHGGDPSLIDMALRGALSAAEQLGPSVEENLRQWIKERLPEAAQRANSEATFPEQPNA